MTEEQDKAIRSRITALTFGVLALMLIFMVVLAVTGKVGTLLFPVGMAVLLVLYWIVSDVLPVIWRKLFEGRTDSQKRAYYYYALTDAAGLAGLIYFIIDMTSITGALVYAVSIFLKRRFWDEFQGVGKDEDEAEAAEAKPDSLDGTGAAADVASVVGTESDEPDSSDAYRPSDDE